MRGRRPRIPRLIVENWIAYERTLFLLLQRSREWAWPRRERQEPDHY
jgi:hypothetical protein